jgi:hypothetical protein
MGVMNNCDRLSAHPFMIDNINQSDSLLKRLAIQKYQQELETEKILTDIDITLNHLDYYNFDVFRRTTLLINTIDRLEKSILFLNGFPQEKTFEKKGVNRFDWIDYHYSYFVLSIHSLFDQSLILTNSVYRIGLTEKDCLKGTILQNFCEKNSPIKNDILSLEKITNQYANIRNLFAHRGEIPDISDETDSYRLELLKFYENTRNYKDLNKIQLGTDFIYKQELLKVTKKLQKTIDSLVETIQVFFDNLEPEYKKIVCLLNQNQNS